MTLSVLTFSLRINAVLSLVEMEKQIEQALACIFTDGDFHGISVRQSELLGMRLLLLKWRGLNKVETFQFIGFANERIYFRNENEDEIEFIHQDISQAVGDLLAVGSAGMWRTPSLAEIEAEADYADELDSFFRGHADTPESETE
ncbi:MAG: hypothetical protein NVSMB56_20550 [Pyrinomonadaceae bacterium]